MKLLYLVLFIVGTFSIMYFALVKILSLFEKRKYEPRKTEDLEEPPKD
jgi:predicted metal-binding membrane protein